VAAVWHFASVWNFPGAGLWRWLLCAALIAGPYVWLGRFLTGGRKLTQRIYRFAD
jgi:hypothetical protein